MNILTGVGWHFSASHFDAVRKEVHGHDYEVMAWFRFEKPRDACVLQARLRETLAALVDHKTLPEHLTRAEQIAEALLGLMDGCVRVQIWRPAGRLAVDVTL